MKSETIRVFFALWPDVYACDEFTREQSTLVNVCGGRLMRPDTLHVTLVFLGEVEVSRLEALTLVASEVCVTQFKVCFDVARYWGHNHILYAAFHQAPDKLLQLAAELRHHLALHGFKFDVRTFKPHITLLRNVFWTDDLLPVLPVVCWEIKEFVLLQSPQGGGTYQTLARFPLVENK